MATTDSASSSSLKSQQDGDLLNWELVNDADDDDLDLIYAEVQSLDSFPSSSDEQTLEIDPPEIEVDEAHQCVPDSVNRNQSDANLTGSVFVERNFDEGYRDDEVVVDGVGCLKGDVDLGRNPFLELESLHQFIGNAIDLMGFNGSVDVDDHDVNVNGGNVNGYSDDHGVNCIVCVESSGNGQQGRIVEKTVLDHDGDDHDEVVYVDYDDDDDDVFGFDGDYGLDDVLIARGVANRIGGQRMKKLANKSIARMTKSKPMGRIYTTRGCIRATRGLALKAY